MQENGEYALILTTFDNEKNTTKEKYRIVITDPVAIISMQPSQGDTSTHFNFNANKSYSVVSHLKLFTWDVFDDT